MFTNLIESDSHRQEFKRRSSFFLATVAAYALILFAAGITSIYAYDAHLEGQNSEVLISWLPAVTPTAPASQPHTTQPPRRSTPSNAPVDPHATIPERTAAVAPINDPTKVPDKVGVQAGIVPAVTGDFHLGTKNVDPPNFGQGDPNGCATCNGTARVVPVEETTPPPVPVAVKPPTTQRVTSIVLTSKAISLPQPQYPQLAKQIRAQGAVNVQILVDEQGRVVSAQAVSGHPMLLAAAKEAALRARFTATVLNGQPVKVQGVITYNFVMQ